MRSVAVDRYTPVLRQRDLIARLEARAFKLRREIEDARKQLVRLEAAATASDQETT